MAEGEPGTGSGTSTPYGAGQRFLVLSSFHDYRSPRRAGLHSIADELARRGPTRFFSLRYSKLSRRTGDPRRSLEARANAVESHRGVECFLWKTPVHPFHTRLRTLDGLESLIYDLYRRLAPSVLRDWVRDSDTVIIESGIGPLFFDLIQGLNPQARLIYRASDDLATINVAPCVHRAFRRAAPRFSSMALASPRLASTIPDTANAYYIPHGVDPALAELGDPSPYEDGPNAVSVGSMLFDPHLIVEVSRRFPEVRFHLIGSGQGRHPGYGDNVTVYEEMPHEEALRYIKHADIGVAPYNQQAPAYLAESSHKLMQYDFFGLSAVCPHSVVGCGSNRYGFEPGDYDSAAAAIRGALRAPRRAGQRHLAWAEVVDRLLAPQHFPDTSLSL